MHTSRSLVACALSAWSLQLVCGAVEFKEMVAASAEHLKQIECLEVDATLESRDLTAGKALEESRARLKEAAAARLEKAEQAGDEGGLQTAQQLADGAEGNAIGGYLNKFSRQKAHLLLDREGGQALSVWQWDWDSQERAAVALGLSREGARRSNLLRSFIKLREGNRMLTVTRWGPAEMAGILTASLSSVSERRPRSLFMHLNLEPIVQLGLLPDDGVGKIRGDFPLSLIKRSKQERDDLVVLSFRPRVIGRSAFELVIHLKPSLGYRIVERKRSARRIVCEHELFEYAQWEGRVFLKKHRRTYFDKEGNAIKEEIITVDRVAFREGIPEERFTVSLPGDSPVADGSRCLRLPGTAGTVRTVSVRDAMGAPTQGPAGKASRKHPPANRK